MDADFIKMSNALYPASEQDEELLRKVKQGETVRLTLTRPRNIQFHRKFMSLMRLAYDYFEPPEHGEGSAWAEKYEVQKNFDRFRKDITILAGFSELSYRLNGDIRVEAKSIAFGKMDEEEFEKLYSKCIDVILAKVCTQFTEDELRSVVDQVMDYA